MDEKTEFFTEHDISLLPGSHKNKPLLTEEEAMKVIKKIWAKKDKASPRKSSPPAESSSDSEPAPSPAPTKKSSSKVAKKPRRPSAVAVRPTRRKGTRSSPRINRSSKETIGLYDEHNQAPFTDEEQEESDDSESQQNLDSDDSDDDDDDDDKSNHTNSETHPSLPSKNEKKASLVGPLDTQSASTLASGSSSRIRCDLCGQGGFSTFVSLMAHQAHCSGFVEMLERTD